MSDYPAHGFHCNARTYPTRCRYCGKLVFFFSCDHGSKVFFDELGAPWKEHACIEMGVAFLGKERIEQEIAEQMMTSYMSVNYERYVKFARKERKDDPKWEDKHLTRLDPYHNVRTEEWGIIRELNLDANIFKRLKVEDTPMWRKALGELVNETQAQVTIHTGALGDTVLESITFYVKQKVIKNKALTVGDFVRCILLGFQIPGREPIWRCSALYSSYE